MWVKLDDGFTEHPKIARVGAVGAWLQIQALCYANRNLTDGFIPDGIARSFLSRGVTRLEHRDQGTLVWTLGEHNGMQGLDLPDVDWLALMVDARLWEIVEGGYVIHDYREYQPTRAEVLAERTRHAKNQQAYRERTRTDRSVTDNVTDESSPRDHGPVPVPVPGSQKKKLAIARKEKHCSWPEDFTLTDERAAYATRQGLDARYQWGKFEAHAKQDDRQHVNWDRAWQYWIRNAWEIANRRHA